MDSFGHPPSEPDSASVDSEKVLHHAPTIPGQGDFAARCSLLDPKTGVGGLVQRWTIGLGSTLASINYTDLISRRIMGLNRVYFGTLPGCAGRFGNLEAFGGSFGSLGFAAFGPRWQ